MPKSVRLLACLFFYFFAWNRAVIAEDLDALLKMVERGTEVIEHHEKKEIHEEALEEREKQLEEKFDTLQRQLTTAVDERIKQQIKTQMQEIDKKIDAVDDQEERLYDTGTIPTTTAAPPPPPPLPAYGTPLPERPVAESPIYETAEPPPAPPIQAYGKPLPPPPAPPLKENTEEEEEEEAYEEDEPVESETGQEDTYEEDEPQEDTYAEETLPPPPAPPLEPEQEEVYEEDEPQEEPYEEETMPPLPAPPLEQEESYVEEEPQEEPYAEETMPPPPAPPLEQEESYEEEEPVESETGQETEEEYTEEETMPPSPASPLPGEESAPATRPTFLGVDPLTVQAGEPLVSPEEQEAFGVEPTPPPSEGPGAYAAEPAYGAGVAPPISGMPMTPGLTPTGAMGAPGMMPGQAGAMGAPGMMPGQAGMMQDQAGMQAGEFDRQLALMRNQTNPAGAVEEMIGMVQQIGRRTPPDQISKLVSYVPFIPWWAGYGTKPGKKQKAKIKIITLEKIIQKGVIPGAPAPEINRMHPVREPYGRLLQAIWKKASVRRAAMMLPGFEALYLKYKPLEFKKDLSTASKGKVISQLIPSLSKFFDGIDPNSWTASMANSYVTKLNTKIFNKMVKTAQGPIVEKAFQALALKMKTSPMYGLAKAKTKDRIRDFLSLAVLRKVKAYTDLPKKAPITTRIATLSQVFGLIETTGKASEKTAKKTKKALRGQASTTGLIDEQLISTSLSKRLYGYILKLTTQLKKIPNAAIREKAAKELGAFIEKHALANPTIAQLDQAKKGNPLVTSLSQLKTGFIFIAAFNEAKGKATKTLGGPLGKVAKLSAMLKKMDAKNATDSEVSKYLTYIMGLQKKVIKPEKGAQPPQTKKLLSDYVKLLSEVDAKIKKQGLNMAAKKSSSLHQQMPAVINKLKSGFVFTTAFAAAKKAKTISGQLGKIKLLGDINANINTENTTEKEIPSFLKYCIDLNKKIKKPATKTTEQQAKTDTLTYVNLLHVIYKKAKTNGMNMTNKKSMTYLQDITGIIKSYKANPDAPKITRVFHQYVEIDRPVALLKKQHKLKTASDIFAYITKLKALYAKKQAASGVKARGRASTTGKTRTK